VSSLVEIQIEQALIQTQRIMIEENNFEDDDAAEKQRSIPTEKKDNNYNVKENHHKTRQKNAKAKKKNKQDAKLDRVELFWHQLCLSQWTHETEFPKEQIFVDWKSNPVELYKRLYLCYKISDIYQHAEKEDTKQEIHDEKLFKDHVAPFICHLRLNSIQAVLFAELQKFQNLQSLDLTGFRKDSKSIPEATAWDKIMEILQSAELPLRFLNFKSTAIDDAHCLQLCGVLLSHPYLEELNLTWNAITDKSVLEGIIVLMQKTRKLKQIDLRWNNLSMPGRRSLHQQETRFRQVKVLII
jgi:hypothetical protein